jgi:hypothetical protein
MSSTDRQNRLLLAEDWKTIYQSFKYADFKSYDFDNLRRTMIEYLRENYPEDFNDYIESSEYLALIDMIAFLGQNISFRIDLNARENFIELAERKESVLRLANLLSYNATRNKPAQGLLKFTSVRTSEQVTDSNGFNLANRSVIWNDTTNPDWFEQFTKILNAGLPVQNTFGTPVKSDSVAGVATEQYRLNNISNNVSVFTFSKPVNSRTLEFEIVSTGIENGEILEEAPLPGSQFSFLYRDNGQGPGSNTTGFFAQFRQGTMQRGDFNIDSAVPNQKVDIDAENINQTDVWLYKLDSNGREGELWNKVDAVEGNNVVFNSLNKKIRSIYSVLTRSSDRVSLVFADGIFGDLPKGKFRSYYRSSANSDYTILPPNMTNVTIRIPYLSNANKPETLTVTLDLKVAVNNASSTETIDSIKSNAPSTYYTQNRLITAEDYNVGPLGVSQDIIKVKSVNRTASGISRNYDILDATGKYSNTNLFGTDGVLYKENIENRTTFKFRTRTDIESEVENTITNILQNKNVKNFYLSEYLNQNYSESDLSWNSVTSSTNRSTGLIKDTNDIIYTIGSFTEGPLRFFETGAMVKFIPPVGYAFLNEKLTTNLTAPGTKLYMWSKVISVSANGTEILDSGLGPIVFNDIIPDKSILSEIKPKFVRDLSDSVKLQIIDNAFAYRTFGLRYDRNSRAWTLITQENLNVVQDFNLGLSGDESGQQLDSSWVVLFETNGTTYNVTYRSTRYIFESDTEVRFYFDSAKKIYDSKTGKVIRDKVSILSINTDINTAPGTAAFTRNFEWEISSEYRDASGYVDSKKIEVTFFDSDDDGVVDDPDIFENIVNLTNYVFTKKSVINNSQFEVYVNSVNENIVTVLNAGLVDVQAIGNPIYYIAADNVFRQLDSKTRLLTTLFDYKSYIGREALKFQYNHTTDENTRIDPSSTNIIDTYILTRQYDTIFRQYLNNIVTDRPLPPSSDQLFRSYGAEINKIKSISDEVIYQPVKYRVLFGNKSEPAMQAVFKIVKNSTRVVNDNDLKSRVISAVNNFFALDNWDFGETFYWSELSAYVMKDLSPDLSSIIIVPRDASSSFGSLFEIKLESDEIFISSAVVDDVEVITAITADRLKSEGAIVTSVPGTNTGIYSATSTTSTNTGGFIY